MTRHSFHLPPGGDTPKAIFGLVLIVALAWTYTLLGAGLQRMDMEKNLPWGSRIALLAGAGLVAWGGVSLAIAAL